jgi:homospermidine synthase
MQGEQFPIYGEINDVCVIGHGSIGRGTVPLIKRHFKFDNMTIIDPDPVDLPDEDPKVEFKKIGLTRENFKEILDQVFINKVGFCVNLSVGTSSSEIIQYCQEKGVFYIDTVKEEWEGFYSDQEIDLSKRSNYGIRETLLHDVRKHNRKTTAVSCCGANPGMVSWMVKQALLNLAKDTGFVLKEKPKSKKEWALLMKDLGVKGVHIAERDTQRSALNRPEGEFWNTWSVDGFISEGYYQPSELGWGTHEKWMPSNAKTHREGSKCSIYLTKPGMSVQVKTWCPTLGPQYGFLVTHDESISITDFFTVKEGDNVIYRPTVHYAYHPCQDAVISALESIGSG